MFTQNKLEWWVHIGRDIELSLCLIIRIHELCYSRLNGGILSFKTWTINHAVRVSYMAIFVSSLFDCLCWYTLRVEATQLLSTSLKNALPCSVDGYLTGLCRNNQTRSSTMLARTKHDKPRRGFICQPNKIKIACKRRCST